MSTAPFAYPAKPASVRPGNSLIGDCVAPGDKSISHRSIIFGSLAEGTTIVAGLLDGADIHSTIGAMRAMGADINKSGEEWHVTGVGRNGLSQPERMVDCGNAGTGVRLIMGAVAAYPIEVTFTGDVSLRSRPMGRITGPLNLMGIETDAADGNRLPVTIKSDGRVKPIDYAPAHASAQVKSAVLLAGLRANGTTIVREPRPSRDHSENMLRAFGANIASASNGMGRIVSVTGPTDLVATRIDVPGDPSSAAFPIVAALITPGSNVCIRNVMMNPTRTGLFETLVEMGADLQAVNFRESGGEIIADIQVKYSELVGITVPAERAPSMIDEYPVLAVAAAYADGKTHMPGIGELRVKESDRIAATENLLKKNGVEIRSGSDSLTVIGGKGTVQGGGTVETRHDHRIAMCALVLGLATVHPVFIDDASMIATSFPSFFEIMNTLGADMGEGL